MARLIKQRSKKAGLPPGSLVHIGEKKGDQAKVAILDYDEAHVQEKEVETIEETLVVGAPGRRAEVEVPIDLLFGRFGLGRHPPAA